MDFLKPSLARHQLAIDNLNFSCCSSETPGDPELDAITGYPDPSGFSVHGPRAFPGIRRQCEQASKPDRKLVYKINVCNDM